MKRLERIFVRANGWAVILILGAMPLIVGANIGLRYLTGHSLSWADEAARYLMIWMTFVGAGLALRMGAHVAITNLQDALPGPGQKLLRGALVLVLLVFFGFMVSVGIDYAQRMQFQLTPALRVPFLYVYAAMPVGFALLIVHLLLVAPQFVRAGTYKDARDEDGGLREGANG
ncbi:TRAP transporter small permease [Roseivivax isoporae]|uniref:TRAP transporter small permease protein n=1 Tax=Roseivivax isoporae LMG 25204 TaxID=1449351 RepID=X7F5U8_9RHOB|nr:TRAP transporter small permease [Roseivivax isoporae]ETX28093.1 C4-dicarboxylate ABC transporter permease [Roseivivax isoporae LMG 25204]